MDLYRISCGDEIEELGIEDALRTGIVILEWPEQAGSTLRANRIELSFDLTSELTRSLSVNGDDEICARYMRSAQIGDFLRTYKDLKFTRQPIAADASARDYEMVNFDGQLHILMNAPKSPDGPPVKNNLPYSQIAHLAEEVRPFVAIASLLRSKGFYAPEIYAHNYDAGLVLLEYLGNDTITDPDHQPIAERYLEAGKLLAAIHLKSWPQNNVFGAGEAYTIPPYDEAAMLIETELLTQWYLGDGLFDNNGSDISEFIAIWQQYCHQAQQFRKSIVLRDYHSPNILWQTKEHEFGPIGLIDFQDAMIGPAVYDLVSLAQDARVIISPELENLIIDEYLDALGNSGKAIDSDQFRFEYALMGAQRASKLLGIFVRLHARDGKPGYRKLIPGIRTYLKRNLQHPGLTQYRQWCQRVIKL